MPELATYEITALALQFCGLDTATNLTVAERNQIGDAEKYIRLYLMRTDIHALSIDAWSPQELDR